ncbi:uncharacterized protein F5Z01DRAFT_58041 [Emericellopsis atlantica]|uniref:Uncharacterized protein n=1 Tax=Emericellopsis atlantica TaxID=2614577 RepID=A0A9P8CQA1_9HYPO|nr:uncharacterized protein F5Z01DRAFT_58041 [Emericellopsis atlantica]KAG9254895.1 hypothetical protein F5Z01DRAFT_58041 [Emericellopsis atlantica]
MFLNCQFCLSLERADRMAYIVVIYPRRYSIVLIQLSNTSSECDGLLIIPNLKFTNRLIPSKSHESDTASIMDCASTKVSNSGPLIQLILRIPTLLWSIQAWLGVPDSIGLFSPPDLAFCQMGELLSLTIVHGLRLALHPSFKINWINGKRPGPIERRRYYLFSVGLTVALWMEFIGFRYLHSISCYPDS